VAPLAVSVADSPRHIAVGFAVAFTVGVMFTVTGTTAVAVQPP
jgi:hypothetical protein